MSEPMEMYPAKGYLYDRDGYHDGGVYLENANQMETWAFINVPFAIQSRRELMITDCWDNAMFHVKDGAILWPRPQDAKESAT